EHIEKIIGVFMQKKDKEKVFGGDWTEEQFREFMLVESYDGTDKDFISGIRAYRHMLPETFAQFVAQFKAEGHNLSAADLEGKTLVQTLASHAQGVEYAEILKAAGAQ
ncbi:PA4642 family protein, partial [Thalassolituus oleivorans]